MSTKSIEEVVHGISISMCLHVVDPVYKICTHARWVDGRDGVSALDAFCCGCSSSLFSVSHLTGLFSIVSTCSEGGLESTITTTSFGSDTIWECCLEIMLIFGNLSLSWGSTSWDSAYTGVSWVVFSIWCSSWGGPVECEQWFVGESTVSSGVWTSLEDVVTMGDLFKVGVSISMWSTWTGSEGVALGSFVCSVCVVEKLSKALVISLG